MEEELSCMLSIGELHVDVDRSVVIRDLHYDDVALGLSAGEVGETKQGVQTFIMTFPVVRHAAVPKDVERFVEHVHSYAEAQYGSCDVGAEVPSQNGHQARKSFP